MTFTLFLPTTVYRDIEKGKCQVLELGGDRQRCGTLKPWLPQVLEDSVRGPDAGCSETFTGFPFILAGTGSEVCIGISERRSSSHEGPTGSLVRREMSPCVHAASQGLGQVGEPQP